VISVKRVSAAGKVQVMQVFIPATPLPSAVFLIPKTEFAALLRKRPELALRMLASMSQHPRGSSGSMI
jgi:uncharacterized membrane protein